MTAASSSTSPSPSPSSSSSNLQQMLRKPTGYCPILLTCVPFIVSVIIFYYSEDFRFFFGKFYSNVLPNKCSAQSPPLTKKNGERLPFAMEETKDECDVFSGKWVRDEVNQPLYDEADCPYIAPQLTCQEHGRPDKDYQYWRWQPHGCDLPSFNATLMLETLRGKRMMFVGDSLNRGQHTSMVCLLQKHIPGHAKSMETKGSLSVFTAKEYNASIEFYWAPLLLESNREDARVHNVHQIPQILVRNGSIMKHGKHWKGVDILVFNTYIWWITGKTFIFQGNFDDEVKDIIKGTSEDTYRIALKSMVGWIKNNMDPDKTRVFFTSMSPTHSRSAEWGGDPGGNCYNETKMIEDPNYWAPDAKKSMMQVLGEELRKSKMPIILINITQLTSYRKDAHTSIYKQQWVPLTPEQLANPVGYADCTHFCLPGLQDTWNELLFAKLFYP